MDGTRYPASKESLGSHSDTIGVLAFPRDLCPVRALKGANLPIGHVGRRSDRKAEFLFCQRLRGIGGNSRERGLALPPGEWNMRQSPRPARTPF